MSNIEIGRLVKQREGYSAFIPNDFPPKNGFGFDADILRKNDKATRLLGKLDGITRLLPDVEFFLLMYLRKDAAASSQIEGTQATMMDAIEAGAHVKTGVPEDVDDILHYIAALDHGMRRVKDEAFPLSLRFIRELHEILMKDARGAASSYPGEFRKSQNWIHGTRLDNARFIPPPVEEMQRSLGDLENFIHAQGDILPVIKAGILHAQFETIHPFVDGNGRTGRMLITFFLWQEGFLEKPVLFLSSYFKKYQDMYYAKLAAYHGGGVAEWISFFLDGVIEIAEQAIDVAHKITALRVQDMAKIQGLGKRASDSAMRILPRLFGQPMVSVGTVAGWTGFSRAGAQKTIDRFVEMGILILRDQDKPYGQMYIYKAYTDIFIG